MYVYDGGARNTTLSEFFKLKDYLLLGVQCFRERRAELSTKKYKKGSTLYKSCSSFHNLIEQDFFIYFKLLKIIGL